MNPKGKNQSVKKEKEEGSACKATVSINPLMHCRGARSVSAPVPHYDAHDGRNF